MQVTELYTVIYDINNADTEFCLKKQQLLYVTLYLH